MGTLQCGYPAMSAHHLHGCPHVDIPHTFPTRSMYSGHGIFTPKRSIAVIYKLVQFTKYLLNFNKCYKSTCNLAAYLDFIDHNEGHFITRSSWPHSIIFLKPRMLLTFECVVCAMVSDTHPLIISVFVSDTIAYTRLLSSHGWGQCWGTMSSIKLCKYNS